MHDRQPCEPGGEKQGGEQGGEQGRDEERPPGAIGTGMRTLAGRPGYWFPLLLFGGLAALSLPLSVLTSPQLPTWSGFEELSAASYPTLTQAMYLGGGVAFGPSPFPMGWYWVGVLVVGVPLAVAWYRWRDRRTGSRTPLAGYLASGLVLAAVTAALPLLGWGMPVPFRLDGPAQQAWTWLNVLWESGTFALLAIAVGLGVLAWVLRSRALAVITVTYAAVVCLTGWLESREVFAPFPYSSGGPAGELPAAILLLAGFSVMLTAGVRALRSRSAAR